MEFPQNPHEIQDSDQMCSNPEHKQLRSHYNANAAHWDTAQTVLQDAVFSLQITSRISRLVCFAHLVYHRLPEHLLSEDELSSAGNCIHTPRLVSCFHKRYMKVINAHHSTPYKEEKATYNTQTWYSQYSSPIIEQSHNHMMVLCIQSTTSSSIYQWQSRHNPWILQINGILVSYYLK